MPSAGEGAFGRTSFRFRIRIGAELQFGKDSGHRLTLAYTISGGDCDRSECLLVRLRHRMADFYVYMRAVEQKAPEWLGGYKAWFISGALPSELRVDGDYVSQLFAAKLSTHLPAWFYLSATPETTTGNLSGKVILNKGQKLPVLFNQGKAMATVFPELEFRAILMRN